MKTDGTHDAGKGGDPQEDDALWRLLDRQAPPAPVSPYFARRVLREVALLEERNSAGWLARLGGLLPPVPRRLLRWSGALALGAVCLTATLNLNRPASHSATSPTPAANFAAAAPSTILEAPPPEDAATSRDVELIADLDNLLQREESRLWTEDTARF